MGPGVCSGRPPLRLRMSQSAAYEPVPTDENINTRDFRPAKVRLNLSPLHKVLAISVAFCLISFVSFKAGQWSATVERLPESLAAVQEPISTPAPAEGDTKESDSVAKPPASDTDMPGNGKYSVG